MGLIRSLFWFAIFVISTFAFTVLFEHGPSNFTANAQKEFASLQKFYSKTLDRKPDTSDKLLK